MIKLRVPASCGELIQGFYEGRESLISLPIDLYSTITVSDGAYTDSRIGPKCHKAVEVVCKELGFERKTMESIKITIDSDIPMSKGMASSTADIAGVIYGLTHFLDQPMDRERLGKICTAIEPTDSTIFHDLTLFDHITGEVRASFDWDLKLNILILELADKIDTVCLREKRLFNTVNKPMDSQALALFKKAYAEKNLNVLGEAATLSSIENQSVLNKPELETIIEIAEKHGFYGVNAAHSGSLLGLLHDDRGDVEAVLYDLRQQNLFDVYIRHYMNQTVSGGIELL